MVQGSSGRIRRGLSWGIFIFTTVLVVAGGIAARTAVEGRDHARFEGVVQSTCDRIENRLEIYTALLLSTRAMLDARDGAIDAAHFRTYVKELDLRRTYPGIQGIGFTRKLPQDRAGFVREVETSGVPGFRVWPDHPGDEHHAVVLLEPLDQRNQAAIGFDMSSEPVRREAMLKARDTGSAVASGPVTLVQEIDDDKQVGFLIYVPIYRGGGVPSSVEARREALLGFVCSPFRSDDLLRGIFGSETPHAGFEVHDVTAPSMLVYRFGASPNAGSLTANSELRLAGRTWSLRFWTLPAFERSSNRFLWPGSSWSVASRRVWSSFS